MGEALREAYRDLFVLKEHPTDADRALIEGKFKSTHNTSDRVAQLMAATFFSLLGLADLEKSTPKKVFTPDEPKGDAPTIPPPSPGVHGPGKQDHRVAAPSLHYNIQIHLPATKDIEVFNAIFKSLKEHLLER